MKPSWVRDKERSTDRRSRTGLRDWSASCRNAASPHIGDIDRAVNGFEERRRSGCHMGIGQTRGRLAKAAPASQMTASRSARRCSGPVKNYPPRRKVNRAAIAAPDMAINASQVKPMDNFLLT